MTHHDPVLAIGIVTGIGALIGWLVDAAVTIAAAVGAALAAMWAVLGPILVPVWSALKGIWQDVLKPAWNKILDWGYRLQCIYFDHIKPILDKFKRVSKILRDVYATFLAPIHDLVSIVDQFLRLTGLIYTPFGQWLDGELHYFDNVLDDFWRRISDPINVLLRVVNEYILDADRLLAAPLLLQSTAKHMDVVVSQWWSSSLQTVSDDWKTGLKSLRVKQDSGGGYKAGAAFVAGQPSSLDGLDQHATLIVQAIHQDDWTMVDYLTRPDVDTPGVNAD